MHIIEALLEFFYVLMSQMKRVSIEYPFGMNQLCSLCRNNIKFNKNVGKLQYSKLIDIQIFVIKRIDVHLVYKRDTYNLTSDQISKGGGGRFPQLIRMITNTLSMEKATPPPPMLIWLDDRLNVYTF